MEKNSIPQFLLAIVTNGTQLPWSGLFKFTIPVDRFIGTFGILAQHGLLVSSDCRLYDVYSSRGLRVRYCKPTLLIIFHACSSIYLYIQFGSNLSPS